MGKEMYISYSNVFCRSLSLCLDDMTIDRYQSFREKYDCTSRSYLCVIALLPCLVVIILEVQLSQSWNTGMDVPHPDFYMRHVRSTCFIDR